MVTNIGLTFWWHVQTQTCVPAAPTGIHHLGHRSAKVEKPIFLSGCSFLKDV